MTTERRLWLNDGSCVRLRPQHAGHVWSYDFVQDRTHNGRTFRDELLNVEIFDTLREAQVLVARWRNQHQWGPAETCGAGRVAHGRWSVAKGEHLMKKFAFVLIAVALACTGVAWAQETWFSPTDPYVAELEVDHDVTTEFETPHTDWGSPWALGSTRVLFFVNGRGTAAREVVELRQRFDLDAQMVFWGRLIDSSKDDWHGGEAGQRRINHLLSQQWDAFVFLGIRLQELTSEQQYVLLKAVADGAGLVLSGVEDSRVFKESNRMEAQPAALAAADAGIAHALRGGRGVLLPAQPSIAYAPGWEVAYDHWARRLGRAILWAAGREPQMKLIFTQEATEVTRTALPAEQATVTWAAPEAREDLTVWMRLRRDDGWEVELPQVRCRGAEGSAAVEVPLLRAGEYSLDGIAHSDRGVEDFGSVAFSVICERSVARIELDREWGEVGSHLRGTVHLVGEPGPNEALRISLLDARGRELMREIASPDEVEQRFRFRVEQWLPMLVTVRATLLQGDDEVSSAWAFANVTKRNRDQFNFLIWDLPHGTLAPYAEESLERTGVTLQLASGAPPPYVAANNIAWVPYTTHIYAKRDDDGVMEPACWNDEDGIQAHVDAIVDKHVPTSHHGVFVYSLGDEIAVRGSCLSPHCLAAYREYLQEQYGEIADLNASWDTDFGSFEEVTLSKPDDNDEKTALEAGNFPRWYDRQAFQSHNFCRLCERFGEGFLGMDEEARCGFEGAGRFRDGDDLDGFVRSNTFWSPYPGTADEVLRSIAPSDFPHSNWMGYTKDADSLLKMYWRMLARGCDSVWWWRWEVIGRFHGWLSPSFDPYPAVKEILRDTEAVRRGLGDLLLESEMLDDGVGILFSQPSAYASKVASSPSYGSYEREHMAWHSAIRELGLGFRYFTDRQMRLGEADLERFRIIVLANAQAIGPVEAEMLRQWVRGGGVLVADVRPGIFDGHVKPLETGILDDVFGVSRVAREEAVVADAQVGGTLGDRAIAVELPGARVDSGITSAGADALGAAGETPIFLVNSFGEGQAVLLNLSMGSYPGLGAEGTPEAAADALQALFDLAGIRRAVVLRDAEGNRLRNVEVTRWRNGDMELLSIFRREGLPEPAELELAGPCDMYDIKQGTNLGRKRSYGIDITPYRAQFFAAMPSGAPKAELTLPEEDAAPGDVIEATVAFPGAEGTQTGYLHATQPDGEPADWLAQVVVAGSDPVTVPLPIAYNDQPGEWRVSFDELCSTRTHTRSFDVREVQ